MIDLDKLVIYRLPYGGYKIEIHAKTEKEKEYHFVGDAASTIDDLTRVLFYSSRQERGDETEHLWQYPELPTNINEPVSRKNFE